MEKILLILVGVGVGIGVSFLVRRLARPKRVVTVNTQRSDAKQEAKNKILALLKDKGEISNNEAESLLQVSDATATNYLQELENNGLITQVHEEGRGVRYHLK